MRRRARTGRLIVERTRRLPPAPGREPARRQAEDLQERPQRDARAGLIDGAQDPPLGASVGQPLARQGESRGLKQGQHEVQQRGKLLDASPQHQDLLSECRLGDAIGNEDVQRLKHHLRHKAPRTVNNVLTVLNTLLKKAVEWQVIEQMPCAVRLLRTTQGAIDFYDFDEYERLVTAAADANAQAHLIVLLGGDAGLRSGEMRALEWTDVNFTKRQVCVARNDWRGHVTSTKGGRLRYVPLTRRLAAALQAHRHLRCPRVLCNPGGQPMPEHVVTDLLQKVARRANLRNNGAHILRHTFCSHLAMRGAPARAIQELAGHRDLSTTQRYMHLSPNAVDDAIRLLDNHGPPETRGEIVETGDQ
jgi:integrase